MFPSLLIGYPGPGAGWPAEVRVVTGLPVGAEGVEQVGLDTDFIGFRASRQQSKCRLRLSRPVAGRVTALWTRFYAERLPVILMRFGPCLSKVSVALMTTSVRLQNPYGRSMISLHGLVPNSCSLFRLPLRLAIF